MRPRTLLLLCLGLGVSACSATLTSEQISKSAERHFEETKGLEGTLQHRDLLGLSAGFFILLDHKEVPSEIKGPMQTQVFSAVEQLGFFPVLLGNEDLNTRLLEDRQMRVNSEIYLDSLTNVAVSDKDLANPLGQYLNVEDLLVFHVSLWPCPTCSNKSTLRLKLRLVDAPSGLIVWTAGVERDLFDYELGATSEIALELADQLTRLFDERFRVKWHKARFANLAKG